MIHSLILQTTTRLLVPLLILFSLYLLVQGHDAPGGGFSGGLIGAGAFALYAIAFGIAQARRALPASPAALIGGGFVLLLASGAVPLAAGRAFLEGMWWRIPIPGSAGIELGTPFMFDAGIYLVVVGAALSIVFELEARHTGLFAAEGEN